jgi:hypothetical protein
MKLELKKVKEVSLVDQFLAVMDFLKTMGYETEHLTVQDAANLKYDIIKAIENCEELDLTLFEK